MKRITKLVSLSLVFALVLVALTGCYDAYGIEELAYVVAIGLDTSDNNNIELTVQIATSGESSSGSQSSSGSTSQSEKSNITSIKCNTIDARNSTYK